MTHTNYVVSKSCENVTASGVAFRIRRSIIIISKDAQVMRIHLRKNQIYLIYVGKYPKMLLKAISL